MLSRSVVKAGAIFICDEDIGMIAYQPDGWCGSRGAENHLEVLSGSQLDGPVEPSEVVYPFFGFQLCPGELGKMGELEPHLGHLLQVSFPLRFIPVFGIVICTYSCQLMVGEIVLSLLRLEQEAYHTERQE